MNLKLISHVHKRSLFVLTPSWENDVWKSSSRILEILKSQFVCDYLNLNLNVQMKSIEKGTWKSKCPMPSEDANLYHGQISNFFGLLPHAHWTAKIWGLYQFVFRIPWSSERMHIWKIVIVISYWFSEVVLASMEKSASGYPEIPFVNL